MLKKNLKNFIIFSVFFTFGGNFCLAQDAFTPLETTNYAQLAPQEASEQAGDSNNDDNVYYLSATDKFVQCNIRSSWTDFKNVIINSAPNDYLYISMANKMADLGFFDLANLAISKISDKDISNVSKEAMETFYSPRRKMKLEDELFLAEMYSNIVYNNQSSEAANDLLNNAELLSNYDYANYLVALGSYKSGMSAQAKKYINIALIQNPTNLNYLALKAKIFAKADGDTEEALKTVAILKKQNLDSLEYENKIKSLEQFILYEVSQKEWLKDYHLGYYYYLESDNQKSIKALQSALSSRKKPNQGMIYSLMSEVYLNMNEYEKAADTSKKAHRINSRNSLITIGDLNYRNKNYKAALKYYKTAASHDKKSYAPLIKEAQAYQELGKDKKAKDIYTKVLKTHSDSWEAYYNEALIDGKKDKDKEVIYIKKALAINPAFESGWIQLAKAQMDLGNYDNAQKYLANAFCIDENDFRYYYYQGLLNKNAGEFAQAKNNFSKCLKLNSNFKDALDELNNLNGAPVTEQKQDSI